MSCVHLRNDLNGVVEKGSIVPAENRWAPFQDNARRVDHRNREVSGIVGQHCEKYTPKLMTLEIE